MNRAILDETLKKYVDKGEIAGAVLLVRKDGELVYDNAYGYANLETKEPVSRKTLFRLASMTKPVTVIAVMRLVDKGIISLYDPVSKYLPEYKNMQVCAVKVGQEVYEPDPESPTGQHATQEALDAMTYVPAYRDITIFDLLTHSSGAGMGPIGTTLSDRCSRKEDTIRERAAKYAKVPLDFQPGTETGYSAVVGFEVLSAVVEAASGMDYDSYLAKEVFGPMGIRDITYTPDEEQQSRIPRLYRFDEGKGLTDVSDTEYFWVIVNSLLGCMHSAGAGLYGTMEGYDKIAQMFLNKGTYNGVQVLTPETVAMCGGWGTSSGLQMIPGLFWGLGMNVMKDPTFIGSSRNPGSYGWSGAFGTHFYVDPSENLTVVLGVNRSNIGGAASYVSFAVEDAVKKAFEE